MDWWGQAAVATAALLDQYGLLAIALLILVEEAGVPVPLPGDAIMLLVGVGASAGQSNPWIDVATLELATVLGASCLYWVAGRAGRTMVYRYGRYVHLSPERLNRTERWLQRRGLAAVLLGRLVPGLSILTTLACGVFGIPYRMFLAGLGLGGLVYVGADVAFGYFFGPAVLNLLGHVHVPLDAVVSLVPMALLTAWLVRARQGLAVERRGRFAAADTGKRPLSGAAAGATAAVSAALGLNFLVQVTASLLSQASNPLATRITARLPPASQADVFFGIALELVAFVLLGIGWGTLYAILFVRHFQHWRLPDAVRGALFAVVPLALTLGAERVVLGAGTSLGSMAAVIFRAAQGVRYLLYGIVLGLACPIFLARTMEGTPPEASVPPQSRVS